MIWEIFSIIFFFYKLDDELTKRFAELLNLIDKKDAFNASKFIGSISKPKEVDENSYQLRDKVGFDIMLNRFYKIIYNVEKIELLNVYIIKS